MDPRAWAAASIGAIGVLAGAWVVAAGQPVAGAVAAVTCGVAAGAWALTTRDVLVATGELQAVHQARLDAERRAEQASDGLAELSAKPGESVVDPASGLFDRRIFDVTFERKLAAARRHLRPLTVMIVDLGPDLPADPQSRADAFRRFGALVTATLRDADVPCRVGETTFGIILEDTAEAGGIWVTDRLQVAAPSRGVRLWRVAVASYPNHGLTRDEVLGHAWGVMRRLGSSSAAPGDHLNLPRGD